MTAEEFRTILFDRLAKLSAADRRRLVEDIRRTAFRRKITYEYDKKIGEEPIRILLPPIFLDTANLPVVRTICGEIANACERALGFYLEQPSVREIFPFEEDELRLMMSSRPDRHAAASAVWQRLDGAMDMRRPGETLRFMETNMNSVGGVYYAPAVETLAMELALPKLLETPERAAVRPNDDLERLLHVLLVRHAQREAGLSPNEPVRVAVVENDPDAEGCTEAPAVVEGLCALGADAFLARPEEFEIRGENLYRLSRPVDLIYRLFELREMAGLSPRKPLDLAFARHRVVSSLNGEFDHKGMFEFLTAATFEKFFPTKLVRIFRTHILWTRVLRETFTDAPNGSRIDLPEFAYASKDSLVLKPNRSYGGEGVEIGRDMEKGAWEAAVNGAMAGPPGGFVVQAFHPIPKSRFAVIDPSGEIIEEDLNVVLGFSATPDGFGVIGRASRSSVVNVAQHGGLVPVLRLEV